MPMHDMLRKKNMQRKTKAKIIKMLLNMVASIFLGDMGVIRCTLKMIIPSSSYDCVLVYLIFSYLISS